MAIEPAPRDARRARSTLPYGLLQVFLTLAPKLTPGPLIVSTTMQNLKLGLWIDPSCFASIRNLRFLNDIIKAFKVPEVYTPSDFRAMLRDNQRDGEVRKFLVDVWDADEVAVEEGTSLRREIVSEITFSEFHVEETAPQSLEPLRQALKEGSPEQAATVFELVVGSLVTRAPVLGFETSVGKYWEGVRRRGIRAYNLGRRGHDGKVKKIKSTLRRMGPLGQYIPNAIDFAFWGLVLPPVTVFGIGLHIPAGPATAVKHL